jgi:hypothetical protein
MVVWSNVVENHVRKMPFTLDEERRREISRQRFSCTTSSIIIMLCFNWRDLHSFVWRIRRFRSRFFFFFWESFYFRNCVSLKVILDVEKKEESLFDSCVYDSWRKRRVLVFSHNSRADMSIPVHVILLFSEREVFVSILRNDNLTLKKQTFTTCHGHERSKACSRRHLLTNITQIESKESKESESFKHLQGEKTSLRNIVVFSILHFFKFFFHANRRRITCRDN